MGSVAHAIEGGWDEGLELALRELVAAWTPAPGRFVVRALERVGDQLLLFTDPEPLAGLGDAAECARELEPPARVGWAVARTIELARALAGWPAPHRDVTPRTTALDGAGHSVLYPPVNAAILRRPRMGAGVIRATARFLSPELLRGTAVGPASDVYQLGMMLRFLMRAPLHPGDSEVQVLQRILGGEPLPPLRASGLEVPEALDGVLSTATASEPDARPSDPAALARALAPWADDRADARLAIARAAVARVVSAGDARRPASRIEDGPIVRPCKLTWDQLSPTDDPAVRSCAQCRLSVHRVTTEAQLLPLLGRVCTAWDPG